MKQGRLSQFAVDAALCISLAVGYLALLLRTTKQLGYARDEGFYFQAADSYLSWFRELSSAGSGALKRSVVDKYWQVNHEHPALIKSLFAAGRAWLHDTWHVFVKPGTSYRVVGMVFASLAVATIYVWARRAIPARNVFYSRLAAVVAALGFALMPRIFYHSHLDCFDIPVLTMWCFTAYVYWESVQRKSLALVLATGVLYGLLLDTKHNSWLLPITLVGHLLLLRGADIVRGLRAFRLRVPAALFAMLLCGPLVFWLCWPWIWFDTVNRLREYVEFHTQHVYYNMEFLGKTYFRPPFPRSYAWVMTAATVPAVTLLLGSIGVLQTIADNAGRLVNAVRSVKLSGFGAFTNPTTQQAKAAFSWDETRVLWLLGVFINYAPWLSNRNPIFGGTKHWTTAYPFLALLAGAAFASLLGQLDDALAERGWFTRKAATIATGLSLTLAVVIGPLLMTLNSHPWGLTTYTPLVGSAPGAASLGLNRSFWGYTTGSVARHINEAAPENARTFIHDTAFQSWYMMRQDGSVRQDLRPQIEVSGSEIAVYHHEQHMSLVEYQIWTDYGTAQPSSIGAFQGVPVVWTYLRPESE